MRRKAVQNETFVRTLDTDHGGALRVYVQRLLGGDRVLAEGIVQQTLLRAQRNPAQVTAHDARPWLFTVARNLAVDARRDAPSVRPVENLDLGLPDALAGGELDAALDACLVADALRALSPRHREVIIAAFFHDQTVADLAAKQGVSEGTVRARMFYALRGLRLALHERGVRSS